MKRRMRRESVLLSRTKCLDAPVDEAGSIDVGEHDTLGFSRRSRRIKDVSQISAFDYFIGASGKLVIVLDFHCVREPQSPSDIFQSNHLSRRADCSDFLGESGSERAF